MTLTTVQEQPSTNSTIANNHNDGLAGSGIGGIADYGTISMVNTIFTGTMMEIALLAAR